MIRGDTTQAQVALVLTGDEFADGGEYIADVLKKNNVKASFFLTGNFYRDRDFWRVIERLKKEGHYMGAHSDKHLLYADWEKRDSLLVTERQFKRDLLKNYQRMKRFGIRKRDAVYFLPPYEWYNTAISAWTRDLELILVNFTPGTRSAADYTYPGMTNYKSSDEIYSSIIEYEAKSKHGLNGFILLIHIGTDARRRDKFYGRLGTLINELKSKEYLFVRIDELLE